eukprot:13517412-Heterocapsa_arctica.AAC.1
MEVDKKAGGEADVIDMTNDDDHYEIDEEHDSSWLFMIEELGDEGDEDDEGERLQSDDGSWQGSCGVSFPPGLASGRRA